MKTSLASGSENYAAKVVRLKSLYPLEGLDNLMGTVIDGEQILVSKDFRIGELYLMFVAETQISAKLLSLNNMFSDSELNADKSVKGYFPSTGRVRAIKLRKQLSTAMITKLDCLLSIVPDLNLDDLKKEGLEFTHIGDVEVCKKYIVPLSKKEAIDQSRGQASKKLVEDKDFPVHFSIKHFLRSQDEIRSGDYAIASIKTHGISIRVINQKVKRKLSLIERIAKKFGAKIEDSDFKIIVGSRNVIKSYNYETITNKRHFYAEDLWTKVAKEFLDGKLLPYEAVYGEVIGLGYSGGPIQKDYTYGYSKPHLQVYRISRVINGLEVDLTHDQMVERCKQMGVDTVPFLWKGFIDKDFSHTVLPSLIEKTIDVPCYADKNVIEEGFCLRIEAYPNPKIFKYKSPKFLLHETKMKDSETHDLEEQN